jgi:predicted Zn-dependent protease
MAKMHAKKIFAALLAASSIFLSVHAAPYLPKDGSQVIEHLPGRNDPAQQEFRRLRTELAAAPNDLALATHIARRYIDAARSAADPRYLGYAQAALSPWWNQAQAPVEVRILRATLLQSTHQFPKALSDLDAILKLDPDNAQAWLTRATIRMVQGDYASAKADCARLLALSAELVAITCLANVANLNGQSAKSYSLLSTTLSRNADAEPSLQIWGQTLLAEMAVRRGDNQVAEHNFRSALALAGTDSYLLGAYADFLLDQQRPAEVISLLKDKTRVDALLLRYAIALKAQKSAAVTEKIDELNSRFNAAMLRADTVHQREQARFELQLRNDPKTALKLAQLNWAVQKEPADARILLEAALLAADRAAAQPVLHWLKQTRLEDIALAKLVKQLGGDA